MLNAALQRRCSGQILEGGVRTSPGEQIGEGRYSSRGRCVKRPSGGRELELLGGSVWLKYRMYMEAWQEMRLGK